MEEVGRKDECQRDRGAPASLPQGGQEGDGELCVAMQMDWPVCQALQTVEDRNTGEEREGGRGGRRNAIKKKGGVNTAEGTLLLAAADFLLKIDGVPAGRRVEKPQLYRGFCTETSPTCQDL